MAIQKNQPVSGVPGNININGYDYPADWWGWAMTSGTFELPTRNSAQFVDVCRGLKRCRFGATGTVMKNFNPFNIANVAELNKYVSVTATVDTGIEAYTLSMLIDKWNWTDESAGVARWELGGMASWKFSNFARFLA